MIAILALFLAFYTASANVGADAEAKKTLAFVQPFSKSYALRSLDTEYIWYTDPDYTDPVGTLYDVWSEMARLRTNFPGAQFSHLPYPPLNEFEYGISRDYQYAVIWSDLHW